MKKLVAFVWLMAVLGACTRTPTEMVVVVRSDIRTLHDVRITVRREPAMFGESAIVDYVSPLEGAHADVLPVAQPVRPANESDTRPVRITVTANDGYPDGFSVSLVVPFVAHEVIEVPVFLADACRDAGVRARCEAMGQVCGEGGVCAPVQVNVVDVSSGATSPASGVDARVVVQGGDAGGVDTSESSVADAREASADVVTVVEAGVTDVVAVVDSGADAMVVGMDASDAHTADAVVDAVSPTDAMDAADPCATGNGGCDPLTACTNTAGSRSCGACPTGYSGTGATQCIWNDPSLTALVPSSGALTPAFTSATTSYAITVGLSTASFSLQPSVSMPSASAITVDGVTVPSGRSSVARALALGDTVFSVVVSAAGGAMRTYTVTVHRAAGVLQQAYVKASNTGAEHNFGWSIALSGNTLAVGAQGESSSATGINGNQADNSARNAGAVYVFTRTGTTWAQQAYIKASNTSAGTKFGVAVALSDDTLAVGSTGEGSGATGVNGNQTDRSLVASGAVYVFTRSGTAWSQQAYVKASNPQVGDVFGWSVALSGDTLAVGASGEDSNATGINGNQSDNGATQSGAVYVFTRTGTTWAQQAYVKASNTGAGDQFGWSVAVSGDTLAVGAPYEAGNATGIGGNQSDNSASHAGAAYVFVRTGTTWAQQAYIKASNTDAGDQFAEGIALSGETLAVGAFFEGSAAIGIDGDQSDNSASHAGAVYVFVRTGTTWAQQAYIKASNTDAGDQFGYSVGLSGDALAVGAFSEDSSVAGIDGNPADNSVTQSGAVYVFVRSGTTWTQRAYVKASNPGGFDAFGAPVALSGETLAVGAPYESSNATGINGNQSDNSAGNAGAAYVFSLAP